MGTFNLVLKALNKVVEKVRESVQEFESSSNP